MLASDLRTGSQRPTLLHEPPDAVDWTLSDIAVDAAALWGYELDDWQSWLVRWTFARRADRLWAARDVGAEVPRQNGKNVWLEVVELAGCLLFGDRLIVHSAHRADVSHEHFLSLKEHIEACDDLMDMMPKAKMNNGFITTNGNESIEFASGSRVLFKARAKASGRGPRPQKIVFDEALVLEQSQIGSMAPGITAQRNPQIIYASSSPKTDSPVLHGLRKRAEDADPTDRLFYAAWNNPANVDVLDRDAMYRVNPSLGYGRMTEESLLANRKTMSLPEYLREHYGVPAEPPEVDEFDAIINPDTWAALADPLSRIATSRCFGLDVSPDWRWASIAAAGRRADQLLHVEAFDTRPGTDWVVDAGRTLYERWRVPIRIQTGSPAAAFVDQLRAFDVAVVEVSAQEHANSVGQLIMAVANGTLRHMPSVTLDAASQNADVRPVGDVELWARRRSKVNITPIVAVTLALGGVPGAQAEWQTPQRLR